MAEAIDWPAVHAEALDILQRYLRIDTSNPPGNEAPAAMAQLVELGESGDFAAARAVHERLLPLMQVNFIESNPIPSKWLLHDMGLIPPGIRLPLTPLSAEYHEAVRSALREAEGALPAAA